MLHGVLHIADWVCTTLFCSRFFIKNTPVRCFVHPKLGSDDCVVNAVQWATYCFLVGVDPTDTKALKSPRTLPPIDSLNMYVRPLMDVSQCACLLL